LKKDVKKRYSTQGTNQSERGRVGVGKKEGKHPGRGNQGEKNARKTDHHTGGRFAQKVGRQGCREAELWGKKEGEKDGGRPHHENLGSIQDREIFEGEQDGGTLKREGSLFAY